MSLEIANKTTFISGNKGVYDKKIKNDSVRYGRNASAELIQFGRIQAKAKEYQNKYYNEVSKLIGKKNDISREKLKEVDKKYIDYTKTVPPENYVYKYMPGIIEDEKIDKMALMGASFEELGRKIYTPVSNYVRDMDGYIDEKMAKTVDLNKDGKIDIAEYATTILYVDQCSNNGDIKGKITPAGISQMQEYMGEFSPKMAEREYRRLYDEYNLAEAQNEFVSEENNLFSMNA